MTLREPGGSAPRRLGLVVTDITNPFSSRVCRDVQRAASDCGYQVLMAGSESNFDRERQVIEGFLEIGVEGLLICPGLDEACSGLYRDLIDQGVRLSFVSRRAEGVEADFVVAHNFAGSALVAGHFFSMGYDSFGWEPTAFRLGHGSAGSSKRPVNKRRSGGSWRMIESTGRTMRPQRNGQWFSPRR